MCNRKNALKVIQNLTDYNFAMGIWANINDFKTYQGYEYCGVNFASRSYYGTIHLMEMQSQWQAPSMHIKIYFLLLSECVWSKQNLSIFILFSISNFSNRNHPKWCNGWLFNSRKYAWYSMLTIQWYSTKFSHKKMVFS